MMPPAPVVSNSHSETMSFKLLKDSWKTPWSINSVSARDHDARGECDYGAGLRVGLGQALALPVQVPLALAVAMATYYM